MKIDIKNIFAQKHLTIFSLLLSAIFLIQLLFIWDDSKKLKYQIIENNYIHEKIAANKIISPNDRLLKVTRFYSSIISVYGVKYHPNKKTGPRQGLNHYQKADFIRQTFELCELLDIPHMLPMALCAYESAFRPYVETDHETGIFQHRPGAVGQAKLYYDLLPAAYKRKCAFTYASRDDLKNPVNALRIQMVLLWGLKKDFMNNKGFYICASHWGIGKIYPLHKKGIKVPEKYEFNKGTLKEDIRNPLMYYYIINAYENRFNDFDLKIGIDMHYIDAYKKACSKLEYGFIEGWKYAQDLIETAKEIKINSEKYEKENQRLIQKYNSKIEQLDNEYRRIHGLIMAGKFKDLKIMYHIAAGHFLELVKEFRSDETTKIKQALIIAYFSGLIIIIILALIGLLHLKALIRSKLSDKNKTKG